MGEASPSHPSRFLDKRPFTPLRPQSPLKGHHLKYHRTTNAHPWHSTWPSLLRPRAYHHAGRWPGPCQPSSCFRALHGATPKYTDEQYRGHQGLGGIPTRPLWWRLAPTRLEKHPTACRDIQGCCSRDGMKHCHLRAEHMGQ